MGQTARYQETLAKAFRDEQPGCMSNIPATAVLPDFLNLSIQGETWQPDARIKVASKRCIEE